MASTEKTFEKPYYNATLSMAKKNRSHAGFALDVGCGKNPYFFHNCINNYIGMDININTLRKVSRNLSDTRLICASGSYAPFRDEIFDLAICTEVLEHLGNPEKMVSEISRALSKGGAAVISIPSLSLPQIILPWIAYKVKKISEKPYQSPDHVREYARLKVTPHFEKTSNLFKLFKQERLEVLDVITVHSLYAKPKILYTIFLSKIEKAFEKIFSKHLIGHYTIFKAEKTQPSWKCFITLESTWNCEAVNGVRICYLANASSVHIHRWVRYFVGRGHEIHVISFENARIEGTTVHVLKLPVLVKNATFPLKMASIHRIKSLIKRIKPDILHGHYAINYGLFGALCNLNPFVITVWGSDVLIVPEARFLSMMKKPIAKYALRKADLITCDAEHMKEAMRRLGIAPEKIILIYFGVDTRKFSPGEKSEELRVKLGIYDSPTVISSRNLEPLYDIESLIRSLPLVLKEVPESQFVIAGKGSEEKRLRELAKSLGVLDNVKFIGFIQNDELPEYLSTVDVYVSTSLSDAGIAASTAEAMACGLPVVVTDVADNKKWVENGVNGFVVPVKDPKSLAEKIIYLLQNEDIRKKFGKVNREIIEERNNYYKEMEKMEGIYEELIRRNEK